MAVPLPMGPWTSLNLSLLINQKGWKLWMVIERYVYVGRHTSLVDGWGYLNHQPGFARFDPNMTSGLRMTSETVLSVKQMGTIGLGPTALARCSFTEVSFSPARAEVSIC